MLKCWPTSPGATPAEERQEVYVVLVPMLLAAGASLNYPGEPETDTYFQRLLKDATPRVGEVSRHRRRQ